MRRVVVQLTVSVPEAVALDDWCALLRDAIARGIDACDAEDLRSRADASTITAVVMRTYESTPRLISRTQHTVTTGARRKRRTKDDTP